MSLALKHHRNYYAYDKYSVLQRFDYRNIVEKSASQRQSMKQNAPTLVDNRV